MKTTWEKYSWDAIENRSFRNSTILLDIDGVLMAHGEDVISTKILHHVEHLNESNDIFIVSNTLHKNRCTYTAALTSVTCVNSPHKKPSKRILDAIQYDHDRPLIVIGDKVLTDGLFAWRIGAQFIFMERRVSKNDHWFIKLIYAVDDIIYYFYKVFFAQKNR